MVAQDGSSPYSNVRYNNSMRKLSKQNVYMFQKINYGVWSMSSIGEKLNPDGEWILF